MNHSTDLQSLYNSVQASLSDMISSVDPSSFELPTPCEGWAVRDLLLHVAAVADTLSGLASTGDMVFVQVDVRDEALVDSTLTRVDGATRAIGRAFGNGDPTHAAAAARSGVIEFAAHGWDLAQACRRPMVITEPDAAAALGLARDLVTDPSRGNNFGPSTEAPHGAGAMDLMAAHLGRKVHRTAP